MKYAKMVEAIVEHVGGKGNIAVATHCMTRPVSYTHLTLPTIGG